MKVIVDTCVWSLALRRKKINENEPYVFELRKLIAESRVQLIGAIRQEILSGIPERKQFDRLRKILSSFSDLALKTEVYEEAAKYFNINRAKGIQGSNADFLICAASNIHDMSILTFDKDFERIHQNTPVAFHPLRT